MQQDQKVARFWREVKQAQLRPGFTPKNYGYTKLKQLIEKYPQIFQTNHKRLDIFHFD